LQEDFALVPVSRLEKLLSRDQLISPDEDTVCDALLRWLYQQPTPPDSEQLGRLLSCLRLNWASWSCLARLREEKL
jgi:hypothetical protein